MELLIEHVHICYRMITCLPIDHTSFVSATERRVVKMHAFQLMGQSVVSNFTAFDLSLLEVSLLA